MNDPASLAAAPRVGSREAERVSFQVVIGARNGQHRLSAEVLDISATGVRLRMLSPSRVGQTFWLTLPMIAAIEVHVVWVEGFVAGCAFAQPLAPYILEGILSAASKAADSVGHTDRRGIHRV